MRDFLLIGSAALSFRFTTLMTTRNNIFKWDAVAVLAASLVLFLLIIRFVPTDIQTHSEKVREINNGQSAYPPNFLYYLVLNILSLFSRNENVLLNVAAVILAVSVLFKYLLTKSIISSWFQQGHHHKLISLTALSCLFLFALPDLYSVFFLKLYYIGRIVPNVWHNSTTIVLFPFAILLFWKQYQVMAGKISLNARTWLILFALMLANVTVKPSFFMVYAPVTSIALLLIFGVKRIFFLNLLPIILSAILLYFLQELIYTYNVGSYYQEKSRLIISKPFEVWSEYMPLWYIPVAMIMSFILPLSYLVLFRSFIKIDRVLLWYTSGLMIMGLIWAIMVAETGPRKFHANFFWQNVICVYLLDVIVLTDALARHPIKDDGTNKKMRWFRIILLLHVLSGVAYIAWMFARGTIY